MLEALKSWVLSEIRSINPEFKWQETLWQPLKGDAGFRQYFRVLSEPSYIAVFAPVETENSRLFVTIGQYLARFGVHTPHVKAADYTRGFLLLEDLGEHTFFTHLNDANVDELYGRALDALLLIQKTPIEKAIFADYSASVLLKEMELFTDWFVPELLNYQLNSQERDCISEAFAKLIGEIEKQPQVIVHRDYHSQNIMYGVSGQPGIVDFQDALCGPVTYDLVSLLRDCYVVWPPERVESWALAYARRLVNEGCIAPVSDAEFMRWFDWMGLQRHIKVLGIFARLSLRDGKHKYLGDLPLVIHYFRSVASKYQEFTPLLNWFDTQLMPIINEQSWMKELGLQ